MQPLSGAERDQIALWHVLQHSVSGYTRLLAHFGDASAALSSRVVDDWRQLRLHANHLQRLAQYHTPAGQQEFAQRLNILDRYCQAVIFADSADYPDILRHLADAPPMLFIVGDAAVLQRPQIAMVGSRNTSRHGEQIARDFAHHFAQQHWVVTSGLATGVDAAAHQGTLGAGQTIAVIGTGLDMCYPASHQHLWQQIVQHGGTIVSEYLPHTPPARQNFPRRNRLISGLSLGTLVIEAGLKSGSLITAKTAAEQGRQVFAIPGHILASHHQGCHQLIREGATLVDHPQQVIDDLTAYGAPSLESVSGTIHSRASQANAVASSTNESAKPVMITPDVPAHVQPVLDALDWNGLSVDELAQRVGLPVDQLNIALVELELLELCKQHAGRYLRC